MKAFFTMSLQLGNRHAMLINEIQAVNVKYSQDKRKKVPKSLKGKENGQGKRNTCHEDPLCFGTERNMKTKFL